MALLRVDWQKIQAKWKERWEKSRVFEADPDPSRPKFFLTVAYPYPNSPQHIGHGRTYTLADVHARYRRMKGYNVLFPMGFHYTGTPILAMTKRLNAGEEDLTDTFIRIYKVPKDALASLREPINIARYFHQEIRGGMKEIGYSIDWRREFTTVDPQYSRFIEWQFERLRDKGLITRGSHPVGWCPVDGNPVGQHDTVGDVEPEIGEYTVIKFPLDSEFLPAATLRPETVFGVTNIWLNPEVTYVKARVDGERWLVSRECAEKMKPLNFEVDVEGSVKGEELIGREAVNPVTGAKLLVLPASFVDPESGTGVVMSVPAHAPYDQQALDDLGANIEELKGLGVNAEQAKAVKPLCIISSEGYRENPALEIIRRMNIQGQRDPKLEDATTELYAHEFHTGVMRDNCGVYAGLRVSEARDGVKADLISSGKARILYELMNRPVVCRCGAECVVKIFENQWFINYGDPSWKALASQCASQMSFLPEDIRPEFEYTIEWLRQRACARKSGLGTLLPWDKEWVIESLSDSVIYMTYYTISRYVAAHGLTASQLTDGVFDYVFLGAGDPERVAEEASIDAELLIQMRKEFRYFYPLDARHSGRDLVPNHLTFFIFNHSAIFSKTDWPHRIIVNGSVLMEGKKMSKSYGNIVPLREAVKEYGADPLRLAVIATAELLQDADLSLELVKSLKERLDRLYTLSLHVAREYSPSQTYGLKSEDRWLLSRLQGAVKTVSEAMERLKVREAVHHIIYVLDQDIQWYIRRASMDPDPERKAAVNGVLMEVLDRRVRMLSPFAPFISEEIWEIMKRERMVAVAEWPDFEEEKIDVRAEEAEELVKGLLEDIRGILRVTKIKPHKIVCYAASPWKWRVYLKALEAAEKGELNVSSLMKAFMDDMELRRMARDVSSLAQKLVEELPGLPPAMRRRRIELGVLGEEQILRDSKRFFERELNAECEAYVEDAADRYDPKGRARLARPYRPAIFVE